MIGSHPSGIDLTKRLLKLGEKRPPAGILDLGAGRGESVDYLRSLGYAAVGIDLEPWDGRNAEAVLRQDMRSLEFPENSFELCLAECSVSVCGDGPAALREALRVLKPGGCLLLSDVFFSREEAPCLSMPQPLTMACWEREFEQAGFVTEEILDETPLWRTFFLESLWNGNADPEECEFFQSAGRAGCGYFLARLRKR